VNRKILAIILLQLFIPFIFFSSAYGGEWVQTKLEGTWKSISLNHVEAEGENWGVAIWQINVTGFQGFSVNISTIEFDGWRRWYESGNYEKFAIRITISNGTVNHGACLILVDREELWGAFELVVVYAANKRDFSNPNDPYELDWTAEHKGWWYQPTTYGEDKAKNYYAWISIKANGNVSVAVYDSDDGKWVGETLAVGGYDFTGQNVTVTLSYYHGGYGRIIADLGQSLEYNIPPFVTPRSKDFWSQVADAIQGTLLQIPTWFGWLASLLAVLFGSAVQFLPLVPLIFVFWILGATVEAIWYGSVEPLAEALHTLYSTMQKIIQVIVNIAQTVWNFIKFW
jgi:hypothetical protein